MSAASVLALGEAPASGLPTQITFHFCRFRGDSGSTASFRLTGCPAAADITSTDRARQCDLPAELWAQAPPRCRRRAEILSRNGSGRVFPFFTGVFQ